MNMRKWLEDVKQAKVKQAMPLLTFPSAQLMDVSVAELIGSAQMQAEGMARIAERLPLLASVSMMDLSVEAEAFGAKIRISDHEVPTVKGRVIESEEDVEALRVPAVGEARTGRYIEALRLAKQRITDRPVFAGVIGPFSLTGRLMDVSEAIANCYEEPEMVEATMEKATAFLIDYIKAYRDIGADGVVMAEPLTGLLSPRLAEQFSEPFVRRIAEETRREDFLVVYHNCGDHTIPQIDSILRTGCDAYHFGDAISMKEMLAHIPADTVAMGNVSPAMQFLNGTAASVRRETLRIMQECCPEHANFVISSGCDIPPQSPWENIDAFFAAVQEYYNR